MLKLLQTGLHRLRGQNIVTVDDVAYKGGQFGAQQVHDLILPRDAFAAISGMHKETGGNLYLQIKESIVFANGCADYVDIRFAGHTGQFRIAYSQATKLENDRDEASPFLSLRGHVRDKFAYVVARRHGRDGQESVTAPANQFDMLTIKTAIERIRAVPGDAQKPSW